MAVLQDARRHRRRGWQARARARRPQRAGQRRQGHRRHPHRARRADHPRTLRQGRQGHPAGAFRPAEGRADPEQSLEPIAAPPPTSSAARSPSRRLRRRDGAPRVFAMKDGDIVLLLENTRFHKGEEEERPGLHQQLAPMATSMSTTPSRRRTARMPRPRASPTCCRPMPAAPCRPNSRRWKRASAIRPPVVAIVGGAKVSTKIDLLMNLVQKVDALVIGGGMANTFLAARGTDVGKSLCEHDLADTAKQIMIEAATAGCAIILPSDGVVAREFKAGAANEVVDIDKVPADGMILDVGPKTSRRSMNGSTAPRRWCGTARSAPSRSSRSTRRPSPPPARGAARTKDRQAGLRRRRRRHGCGAQPCRRGRRLHLRLDRRRRLPRMDGRQGSARRKPAPWPRASSAPRNARSSMRRTRRALRRSWPSSSSSAAGAGPRPDADPRAGSHHLDR
jgi:hypothetical protein